MRSCYSSRWWVGCYIWYSCGPAQSPSRYTKCNSPPINGYCNNFALFDVALYIIVFGVQMVNALWTYFEADSVLTQFCSVLCFVWRVCCFYLSVCLPVLLSLTLQINITMQSYKPWSWRQAWLRSSDRKRNPACLCRQCFSWSTTGRSARPVMQMYHRYTIFAFNYRFLIEGTKFVFRDRRNQVSIQ